MILSLWQSVLSGDKKQARIFTSPAFRMKYKNSFQWHMPAATSLNIDAVARNDTDKIVVACKMHRIYAPGVKYSVGFVHVTSIECERLQTMTQVDLQESGYKTLDDFIEKWDFYAVEGRRWNDNPLVFVVNFGYPETTPTCKDVTRGF